TPVAFWRVAPSVRLRAFAIFEAGSLRAIPLRRRTSSFDHGRLTGAFLLRATALAMSAPVWYVSGTNGVLHKFQSPATLANHCGHLARIFEWRSAGGGGARPTNSISPFAI